MGLLEDLVKSQLESVRSDSHHRLCLVDRLLCLRPQTKLFTNFKVVKDPKQRNQQLDFRQPSVLSS